MKINADKCHLILSTVDEHSIKINNSNIQNSVNEKLLGVNLNSRLDFDTHVSNLCDKASQKLHALARISCYMSKEKRRIIMKAFIESQFGYCPLIWMFHSRKLNNRINRIHERALRIVYEDKDSTFLELLEKDKSFKIHDRNLQKLATELYKVKNGLSPEIISDIFQQRNLNYNFKSNNEFLIRRVRTEQYGHESLSFLGPKIWDLIPQDTKNSRSLTEFKNKIKSWKPQNCPCKLCRTFIPQLGYINIERTIS